MGREGPGFGLKMGGGLRGEGAGLGGEKLEPLNWDLRIQIAVDVARALEYLHDGAIEAVPDLKTYLAARQSAKPAIEAAVDDVNSDSTVLVGMNTHKEKLIHIFSFGIIPAATSTANNETDRVALLAFKAAIVEDPFGALSSWNHLLHYCHWNGILCSRLHPDRVIGLTLMFQGLVGSLSPHMGNLSFLKSIVLQNNSFHGPIPQEMGRLFRLQRLEFSNNSFGGGIPNNLSRCSKLEWLNLVGNNLTGIIPAELGSLSRLGTLALSKNKLSGTIPPFIGNLSFLSILSLSECNLHGKILAEIARLQGLILVWLRGNNLSGQVPSGLYKISPPSFCYHGTMPRDLGKLLGLRRIGVFQNRLQDDLTFISSLTNCTSLQSIGAGYNLFRGSLPDSIANLSTYLIWIDLRFNQIHGSIPSGIGNLLNLSVLSVAVNNLVGPIPSSIGRLHKLQVLMLDQNKFTELPSSIGNLTSLITLNLGENNIHGSIPPTLGNCHRLLELGLYKNNFNGSIPHYKN
ncbi:hypothetical protein TEA_007184 [Camellia sinensis var. sinensis]|uniref:Uncharacterized protein n=1 Tax=Camellia sinensis var. sinensis TaxID=542762 RepID=A0A4S4E908_CAMSN|nr:hypothetical protein TEA_007184 [Camellia sinensis var. sinensis]